MAAQGWKVISSEDGGDVFPAISVMRWASEWRVRPKVAAQRLAKQNDDPLTEEKLLVVPAV